MPSVLNAKDTDPGEPIFSDSDWVNIGLMSDGKITAQGGWAYREELKDFPAEFRKLIGELKGIAAKLPKATKIKALLSADEVDVRRAEKLGLNQFIVIDETTLNELPSLRQAIFMRRRMATVEDEIQMRRFADLSRRMSPGSLYWGLYKVGEQFYEVRAHGLRQ